MSTNSDPRAQKSGSGSTTVVLGFTAIGPRLPICAGDKDNRVAVALTHQNTAGVRGLYAGGEGEIRRKIIFACGKKENKSLMVITFVKSVDEEGLLSSLPYAPPPPPH